MLAVVIIYALFLHVFNKNKQFNENVLNTQPCKSSVQELFFLNILEGMYIKKPENTE